MSSDKKPQDTNLSLLTKGWLVLAVAVGVGLLYALGLYFLMEYRQGLISIAFLFAVPVGASALAVVIIDPRGSMSWGSHVSLGLIVIMATIAAGIMMLQEGGICTIMATPILVPAGALGAGMMGNILRSENSRHLSSAILALPLILIPVEQSVGYLARTETVTSVVDINAPMQVVWKNVLAVPDIKSSELEWTFTQNLLRVPKPLDARLQGWGVGAVRKAVWGGGVRFDERIVAWQENRHLGWQFHFDPDSIPKAIDGHISPNGRNLKVQEGSYDLEPLPGNRTRVVLRTRYWMRTPLNDYCAWWGRIFISDFHRNVLHVIGKRSEQGA